jgi:hypothetical protein
MSEYPVDGSPREQVNSRGDWEPLGEFLSSEQNKQLKEVVA